MRLEQAQPGDTLAYTDSSGITHEGTITHVGDEGLEMRLDGREVALSFVALREADSGGQVEVRPHPTRAGEAPVDAHECPLCSSTEVEAWGDTSAFHCRACDVLFLYGRTTVTNLGPAGPGGQP